jgi:hypothetical protein
MERYVATDATVFRHSQPGFFCRSTRPDVSRWRAHAAGAGHPGRGRGSRSQHPRARVHDRSDLALVPRRCIVIVCAVSVGSVRINRASLAGDLAAAIIHRGSEVRPVCALAGTGDFSTPEAARATKPEDSDWAGAPRSADRGGDIGRGCRGHRPHADTCCRLLRYPVLIDF